MKESPIKTIQRLFSEQPLLFIMFFVALLVMIILVVLSLTSGEKNKPIGDLASRDSGAFLLYKEKTFLPTANTYSNEFIRKDLSYYARQKYKQYDPDKNTTVIFNIDEFSDVSDNKLSFSGKYDKRKELVRIDIQLLNNDRINTIISVDGVKVDDVQLPSASVRNTYIASLPIESDSYRIAYSSSTDAFVVTMLTFDDSVFNVAKESIKNSLGDENIDENISAYYPPALKGSADYGKAAADNYEPEELYGDGGTPVGN